MKKDDTFIKRLFSLWEDEAVLMMIILKNLTSFKKESKPF